MTDAIPLAINIIVSDQHVRNGRPTILGTGLCVSDIAAATVFRGESPDQIAVGFSLSLEQVHAALAYYYGHKAEIDAEIAEQSRKIDEAKGKFVGKRNPLLPR
ncbi:MAG: DUF433 domain-containing protein [Anaerolineae bacterium]|nr:DUF433 domain-containing protein [Anaerolineae bacterium]